MRIGFVFLMVLAAAVLTAALSGCGGGGGSSNLPDPIIRFINSSPDANPIDFFINSDNKAPAIGYLGDSGEVTTKNGDKDVSAEDSTTQDVLDSIAFTFERDKKYVGMTLGLENFGTENEKRLRVLAFSFDKNPPNGSKARLLVIHGYMRETGFQTPSIDFQGGDVGTYDPNNPQFSVTNLGFGADPTELEVDAGVPLIFQARRAGTENVVASDANTTFDDGGIYLAIVTGIENGAGASAPQVKYIKIN